MLSIEFLGICWALGSILVVVAAVALPQSFRVEGFVSWLLLLIVGGAPAAIGPAAATLLPTPDEILVPTAIGFTIVAGIFWIHTIMPRIVPDFQTESLPASCLLAFLQAGAVTGTAYLYLGAFWA